jgi:hypothetical protein
MQQPADGAAVASIKPDRHTLLTPGGVPRHDRRPAQDKRRPFSDFVSMLYREPAMGGGWRMQETRQAQESNA